ncbi:MAG TPA: protein-disulfide reductase DsbD domain-containing protein [Acidobacteriaceae bacterium]|nr:protein-disulfide reductase DsbD domain-containing protein [Acidobacteriaceae bacterium]
MRFVAAMVAFVALAAWGAAQKLPWQGSGQQMVHFLYPQQVTLPAGKSATIDLHFRINPGLHINSHQPLQKSLIRTELIEAEPEGVHIASVDFPAGADYAFPADPSQKLSVYSGEFVLRMHLTARRGDHLMPGELRYQACDDHTCFPPRNLPVPIDVIGK